MRVALPNPLSLPPVGIRGGYREGKDRGGSSSKGGVFDVARKDGEEVDRAAAAAEWLRRRG